MNFQSLDPFQGDFRVHDMSPNTHPGMRLYTGQEKTAQPIPATRQQMLHSYINTKKRSMNRKPETESHVRVCGQYTTIRGIDSRKPGGDGALRSTRNPKHRTVTLHFVWCSVSLPELAGTAFHRTSGIGGISIAQ